MTSFTPPGLLMSRPNLVHPDQPAPLRALLHVYQFLASLKLAVVLILLSAFTYGVGTVVEARYGISVAQFGVYQTWWFNLAMIFLAVNIFCAASIRYPWKRHQTGFVITHIGLLTLLFGTALTRMFGIDSQMFIWEHQNSAWALKDDAMHISMTVHKDMSASEDELRRIPLDVEADENIQRLKPIAFHPGAFSWQDYGTSFWLTKHPDDTSDGLFGLRPFRWLCGKMFQVARLDNSGPGDVLYDNDGIKLEVLDYYADLRTVSAPMINIAVSTPRTERLNADGKPVKSRYKWMMQEASINQLQHKSDEFPHGAQVQKTVFPGGTLAFLMTDDPARVKAFLQNDPKGELGETGQVVLSINGKAHRFNVDDKEVGERFAIEGTDWQVAIEEYWPAGQIGFNEETDKYRVSPAPRATGSVNPAVEIALFKQENEESSGRLILFADQPNLSVQNYENSIYGDYWFDHKDKDFNQRRQHGIGNRIDILQMHNKNADAKKGDKEYQLYYRRWDKTSVVADGEIGVSKGELNDEGMPEDAVDAFTMADQLKFYVEEYIPAPQPETVTEPLPFEKAKNLGQRRPAAKLRLTVDGESEEFWLEAYKDEPDMAPSREREHRIVAGKNRRVAVTLPVDAVDVGLRVRLKDFERRLDPGTSQPSHYASTVDYLDRNMDRKIMWSKLDGSDAREIQFPMVFSHETSFGAETAQVSPDEKYLYWIPSGGNAINRIELDNDDARPEVVIGGRHTPIQPVSFAIDGKSLFWVESISTRGGPQARVRRAKLDGSSEETLAAFSDYPTGLALDRESEFVYWSYRKPTARGDKKSGSIGRVNYAGDEQEDDLLKDDDGAYGVPSSLAVDPRSEKMFWTEPERGLIRSAKLDGTNVRKITLTGEQTPDSITIDVANKRLYWADLREPSSDAPIEKAHTVTERHRIWSADLSGDDAQVIADERIDVPRGLRISPDGERLIWTQEAILMRNVWITMNAPVEFANPYNGQSYRLFQESFNGPFEPGSFAYDRYVPDDVDADELYLSVLTVNYDPGRFIRNLGCLLIVVGIATMFYMRAYFFRRPTPQTENRQNQPPRRQARTEDLSPTNGRERRKQSDPEVIDAKVVT